MASLRRYHPLVAEDVRKAVGYYDKISISLGNRFRASLRQRFDEITQRPESFGRIHQQLRAAMLFQFPYVIVFEQQNQIVTVTGVFHASSDQSKWFERSS